MLKNYLLTTLRKLSRQKNHAVINVLGLALGMTCCLFIFLIIRHESSFDRFHAKRDRIYRVVTDEKMNDVISYTMGTPIPMVDALRTDFPTLLQATATFGNYSALFAITNPDQTVSRFQEDDNVAFVEPEFFALFDFPWLAGEPKSLSEPNTVALTEDVARKYFRDLDPMGRTIRMENQTDLKVVGVVKNFPVNTDFKLHVLVSWKTVPAVGWNVESWNNLTSNVNTFVLIESPAAAAELASKLPAFKNKYHPDATDANKRVHTLQPLREIHHDARYGNFSQRTTPQGVLLGLGLIGAFLLLTACINFINMATAQALNRAKEVGVRKVLGAFRSQLVAQYLAETFVITLFAAALALVFAELLLPRVNELLQLKLSFHPFADFASFLFLALLLLTVALLAGLYPAFVLSRFAPALAIKSKASSAKTGGFFLRRGLVVLQFFISQMLIIGTLVVTQQMDFFRTKEMGFDQNAVITVPLPTNEAPELSALRAALLQDSRIKNVAFSFSSASSGNVWDANLRHALNGPEEAFNSDMKFADASYIPTYDLKLLAGRNYVASDTISEFVVNETFARKLGFAPQDIIGKTFRIGRRAFMPVVGVVQDFHTRPLQEAIRPCALASLRRAYYEASVKLEAANLKEAMAHVEKVWSTTFPEFVFSYEFLDERIAGFYKEEQKMSQLFRVFAGIALFIGCLGLFGLVSFMAASKTKEIGVRKVLGASVQNILLLFGREFALLIGLAFCVAAPVAYWVMNTWLANFAYRIALDPSLFALALGVTVLIAAITVAHRAFKAASTNPVEALRCE